MSHIGTGIALAGMWVCVGMLGTSDGTGAHFSALIMGVCALAWTRLLP